MIYATLGRYAVQLGGVLVVVAMIYAYGNSDGRDHVQTLWDEDKAARRTAEHDALTARLLENQSIESERAAELQKTKESYEKQIIDLGKRPLGRLYLPKAALCDSPALSQGGTDTNSTNDPAGSVRLPERVEQDIQSLMSKADVIRVRLTALQEACK